VYARSSGRTPKTRPPPLQLIRAGRRGLSCKKAQRPVGPSALSRGRPFPSSRRRFRCKGPRRR
jgi:hypothetical protein